MDELILPRPEAGEHIVIESVPCICIVAQFTTDEFVLEDKDADIIFSFDNGASVVLKHFYTVYSPETVPDFAIDEVVVDGSFFYTMHTELMPEDGVPNAMAVLPGEPESIPEPAFQVAENDSIHPELDTVNGWTDADTASYLLNTTGTI